MGTDPSHQNGVITLPPLVRPPELESHQTVPAPSQARPSGASDNDRVFTDSTNAERFAERNADDVRYVTQWREWIVWDGKRWCRESHGKVLMLIKESAREMRAEAGLIDDRDESEKMFHHATKSENKNSIMATEFLARATPPMPIDHKCLDANPWLLNFNNGTLDLKSGDLRPHDRGDYITQMIPYDYPAQATDTQPTQWLNFLYDIFAGDKELIAFMQRLLGCMLAGEQIEHIFPIFYGVGNNGKSTLTGVLLAALGEYGIVLGEDYFVQTQSKRHSTEVMDLYQKRLAVQAETDEGARLNESRIKQQTGKNKIRANRMHHDKTEFEASHTFILETNHKPRIVGTDVGIWRRVLLIPFEVQIPECKRDPDLDKKLLKELPLIMRWMVAGCLKWREHGLNPPEKVRVATDKYREESDLTAAFVEECCFVSPDLKVPALALYRRYNQWANERGESPMGSKRFRERMEQMRFACKRSQRCNLYLGLNLKSYDGEPAYDTGQTNTMEHWQLNSEL